MNKIVTELTKKIVPFILLGMMGLLIANKSAYIHTHKLADGSLVTHAHPYDKSNDTDPNKTHHHSKTELLFLHNIEILFLTILHLIMFLSAFDKTSLPFHFISFYGCHSLFPRKERAPPYLIFL